MFIFPILSQPERSYCRAPVVWCILKIGLCRPCTMSQNWTNWIYYIKYHVIRAYTGNNNSSYFCTKHRVSGLLCNNDINNDLVCDMFSRTNSWLVRQSLHSRNNIEKSLALQSAEIKMISIKSNQKVDQITGQLSFPHLGITKTETIELKHKTDEHISPVNSPTVGGWTLCGWGHVLVRWAGGRQFYRRRHVPAAAKRLLPKVL